MLFRNPLKYAIMTAKRPIGENPTAVPPGVLADTGEPDCRAPEQGQSLPDGGSSGDSQNKEDFYMRTLEELRVEIDRIDQQMVQLFEERMQVVAEVMQ